MSDIGAMSLCDGCQYWFNICSPIYNQYGHNNIVPICYVRYWRNVIMWRLSILVQYLFPNIQPIWAKQYCPNMFYQILAQCHYVTAVNIGSISIRQYATNMGITILSQYVMSDIGAMSLCDGCQYWFNICSPIYNQYGQNYIVPICYVRYWSNVIMWQLSILFQYTFANMQPICGKQYCTNILSQICYVLVTSVNIGSILITQYMANIGKTIYV